MKCLKLCAVLLLTSLLGMTEQSYAQNWPTKPIVIVVPFAAGGSTDATGRLLAARLSTQLGQPVVIENRGGGGANIGASLVARAPNDGHTVLLMTTTHLINKSLYKKLNYDLVTDLQPVARVVSIPFALVVAKSVPVESLDEFIELVRTKKSLVRYGSAGNGSTMHIAGALFNSLLHGEMMHVPYKGSGPAIIDLLAGRIEAMFSPLVDVLPHAQSGQLKILGMTTRERVPLLPQVKAIGEKLTGFEVPQWNGLMVPDGTPTEVVDKLNKAVLSALSEPEVKAILLKQGSVPLGGSPGEFAETIKRELPMWEALVQAAGAKSAD